VLFLRMKRFIDRSVGAYFFAHPVVSICYFRNWKYSCGVHL